MFFGSLLRFRNILHFINIIDTIEYAHTEQLIKTLSYKAKTEQQPYTCTRNLRKEC